MGIVVFIRGVAVWELVVGLSYLLFSLTLVDAYGRNVEADMPWIPLPWGLTQRQLISGASVIAIVAVASSILLWWLTFIGRVTSTLVLAGLAAWAVWILYTTGFESGPAVFAIFNGWLASILWRADSATAFRSRGN